MENQPSLHPVADYGYDVGVNAVSSTGPPTPNVAAASVDMRIAPAAAPQTAPAALPSAPMLASSAKIGSTAAGSSAPTGASNAATSSSAATSGSVTAQSLPRHLNTVWDYTSEYGGELYTVRWESDLLMELCDSVTDMVVDVLGAGTRELLKQTALATLVTAIAIPYAMVRAADSIDSVWTLAVERADEAGIELAKSLLDSQAGHRPVTLLGFSMGARAIYSCLKEIARHQEKWEDQRDRRREEEEEERMAAGAAKTYDPSSSSTADLGGHKSSKKSTSKKMPTRGTGVEERVYSREPASIVEDVILMGTPNHVSIPSWKAARRVVSGRLVNCYSTKDMILSVLFQYKRLTGVLRPVCGCAPVRVPGVENYDVTNMLNSHADYTLVVGDILRLVRHGQPRPTRSLGWYGQEKLVLAKPGQQKGVEGTNDTSNATGTSTMTARPEVNASDSAPRGGGGGGSSPPSRPLISPLDDERGQRRCHPLRDREQLPVDA